MQAIRGWIKEEKELKKVREETVSGLISENIQVNILFDRLRLAKKGTEEWNSARKAIQDKYGNYLNNLSREAQELTDIEAAYRAVSVSVWDLAKAKALSSAQEAASKSIVDALSGKAMRVLSSEFGKKFGKEGPEKLNEFINAFSAAGGKIEGHVKDIYDQFTIIADTQGHTYNPLAYTTNNLAEVYDKANASIANTVSLFGVFKQAAGKVETVESDLLKLAQARRVEAERMPATTEAEIIARNKAVAAADAEIARLNGLGVISKKNLKDREKHSDFLKKIYEDELKATRDYSQMQIDTDAAAQNELLNNNKASYESRLIALQEFLRLQRESIETARNSQVDGLIDKIVTDPNSGTTDRVKAAKMASEQIKLIDAKMWAELLKIDTEGAKLRTDIDNDYAESVIKNIVRRAEAEADTVNLQESSFLVDLARDFAQRAISAEEYEAAKTDIAKRGMAVRLKQSIKRERC